jgi:hypothetical protein
MTHNTKWIVGILIVVGIVAGVGIAAVIGLVYYVSRGQGSGEFEAHEVEGREFGKTTDQAGCMKEGLERAKAIRLLEVNRAINNQAFAEECLKSARSTSGFCEGVPPMWTLQDNEWARRQCEKVRLDPFQTSCTSVFHAKLNVCHGLK